MYLQKQPSKEVESDHSDDSEAEEDQKDDDDISGVEEITPTKSIRKKKEMRRSILPTLPVKKPVKKLFTYLNIFNYLTSHINFTLNFSTFPAKELKTVSSLTWRPGRFSRFKG